MANNKSARKRIKVNQRNNLKNRFYKSTVKTLKKSFKIYIQAFDESHDLRCLEMAKRTLNITYSLLDKGAKRNVFTKKNAARQKSRLRKLLRKGEDTVIQAFTNNDITT
jgi:small subunit ribosomal protein S20